MILITGATGLVGSHVALYLLQQGKAVRAIYRSERSVAKTRSVFTLYGQQHLFGKIEWVAADILDIPSLETAFKDVDRVYHCAALISFDPGDDEILRKTNIEGTANIVNFCLEYGVVKLCHISSAAALGDIRENETTIDEESQWNPEKPHSDYAISKYGAEMEIWRGQQEGLDVVILNPGIIIGPPLWESGSSQLFHLVRKGQRFYTNGTMGFVSVEDVAAIAIQIMDSEIKNERFILSAATLTYREVFFMAADAMKAERASVEAKPWMTSLAWKLDYLLARILGRKRQISKDDARALHSEALYSNRKLIDAVHYNFKPIGEAMVDIARLMKW